MDPIIKRGKNYRFKDLQPLFTSMTENKNLLLAQKTPRLLRSYKLTVL